VQKKVGLVGIGLVGTALAERFLSAGWEVVGFDIDPARCAHLRRLGGRPVSDARSVAAESKRVVLSLLTTDVVKEVVWGPKGLLDVESPPHTIVDTTTGDPDQTIALAHELQERAVAYLDATISGSSQQVRLGEAVFMVGGRPDAYQANRDLLAVVSSKVFYVGPSGSGSKAKLASNLVLGLNRIALAEGLVFAEKLGLDLESFVQLLMSTPAYSAIMDTKGPKMLSGDFAPQARLSQHRKDVAIICRYAQALGQDLPLTRAHLEVLDRAIAAGDGDLDNAAVIRQIKRQSTS
jgi:3-hydroxyisobutyrate dehydrogenase-like beta-hydroxyacid dehydrogenase